MIKDLVQEILDNVLYPKGIYTHEQRKIGPDTSQYVVYRMGGDSKEAHADDEVLTKAASITVIYFYRTNLIDNYETKQQVREIEDLIESALEDAGFSIPYGRFDGGDINDIGYYTTIFECEYWRVV